MNHQWLNYKSSVYILDLNFIHPNLLLLLSYISQWCALREIRFEITSIIRSKEQDRKLGAKSTTHQEGRAFDFSIRREHGWTPALVNHLVEEINHLVSAEYLENGSPNPYYDIGAISSKSFKQKPIVIHDAGNGAHGHVQVRRTIWHDKLEVEKLRGDAGGTRH